MTIEPKISKYIDEAIDRSEKRLTKHLKELSEDSKQRMTALKEFFHDDVRVLAELIQERPTREQARTIAREEMDESLRPINAKLDFLNEQRKDMLEALEDIKA